MTTLAFDLIGVLAEPSWRELAAAPSGPASTPSRSGSSSGPVSPAPTLERWRLLRVGAIDEADFWDDAAATAYRACLRFRADRLALLARLRARGHRIVVASNFARAWLPSIRALVPDPGLMAHWFVSGELGVAKPDPGFWQILREDDPNPVLIDDQPDNLRAAACAGLRALWALPGVDLETRLSALLDADAPARPCAPD